MIQRTASDDPHYQQAVAAVESTLRQLRGCPAKELAQLQTDIAQLDQMYEKVTAGRVEIVIFGEISTGKSALINALIGKAVAEVDVQGGWTKQVWGTSWEGAGHVIHGLEKSELVLIDTPGINEVGGVDRAELAETTARRADLIVFVTDSDLNDIEYASLLTLSAVQKPIILVFNKCDLYKSNELATLLGAVAQRVSGLIPPEHIVATVADPRPIEHVIQRGQGRPTLEWKKPEPDVAKLKSLILETLEQEGLGLIALNAAMYAADKSDRIASLRVKMRNNRADQIIWTMAATKAIAVSLNPIPVFDIVGGFAVDALMIVTLSSVYGLNFSMAQSRGLAKAIAKAAGIVALGELPSWLSSGFKLLTASAGTPLTMIPQGAAAGFGSYIIGNAAKYYFEHGGSWGSASAKSVVAEILRRTDKRSVLSHLKNEIRQKLNWNRHAKKAAK